jgi:alginate O-acetyltransferase complex protein AlgI
LNGRNWPQAAKAWLVLASLFFYGFWDIHYIPLILISIALNDAIGTGLSCSFSPVATSESEATTEAHRRLLLVIGIVANLLLLGYFKYIDFLIENINAALSTGLELQHNVLPLAISFFTFIQLVYLVDSYRGETSKYDLLNYALL